MFWTSGNGPNHERAIVAARVKSGTLNTIPLRDSPKVTVGQPGTKHIAMFLSSLRGGGAERVFLDLAGTFSARGHRVDLLLSRLKGDLVSEVPRSVRVIEIGTSPLHKVIHALLRLPCETWRVLLPTMIMTRRRKVRGLPRIERYLAEERPDALMASTYIPNLLALWAARLARAESRVVIKVDNSLGRRIGNETDSLIEKLPFLMNRWYRQAHGIVVVSSGLADELSRITSIPRQSITVIYNPIHLDRIDRLASQELEEPWFFLGQPPVLVAAGRLHRQKDYPTLLRAFASVRGKRKVRLVILGEGQERRTLEGMIRELGLADDVRLAGFQSNPFAYMARAAVFVLSSAWEGLSNVLIEALACGCRVVSTDCPHGPAEILEGGRYGLLVPVGDPAALAQAIQATLERRPDPEVAKSRARIFDSKVIVDQYLRLLLNR